MPKTESIAELRKQVEREIADHPNWCGPNCKVGNTFLPDAYREARLVYGVSAKALQDDYDSCHIFR